MYIKYFGLSQSPFRTAPDPEYFFASGQHLRAVDRVVHAIRERAGLVLVMGEIGQGKTTVCRYIQKRYADEFCIGYLGNPFLSPLEFGEQILLEFGVSDVRGASRDVIRSLTDFLRKQERAGRIPVLFLDEAHLLSPAVLEFLLIVTNIQHGGKHLLQMVLTGQNEFQETLRHPRFSSLNQRLGTRIQVTALTPKDVFSYITFRLAQAGGAGKALFSRPSMIRICKVTKGNPRLINQVCERLLERAYEKRSQHVRRKDVDRLINDPIFVPLLFPQGVRRIPWGGMLCAGLVLLVMLGVSRSLHTGSDVIFPAFVGVVPSFSDSKTTERRLDALFGENGASQVSQAVVLSEHTQGKGTREIDGDGLGVRPVFSSANTTSSGQDTMQEQLQYILKLLEEREEARTGETKHISSGKQGEAVASSPVPPAPASIAAKKRFAVAVRPQPEKKTEEAIISSMQAGVSATDKSGRPTDGDTTVPEVTRVGVLPSAPGIHVDAIVWDTDPEFRLAVVNEHIVKEGEMLGTEYRLEKIYHEKIRFSKDGRIYEGRVDQRSGRGGQW